MTGPSLWQLVQRWEEGRQQGREPTAAEVCHDCPDLVAEIDRLLPLLRTIRCWPADDGTESSSSGTLTTMAFKPPTVPAHARGAGSADSLAPAGYEILGEIGRGGMGVVYKARQMRLDRVVALKMILAQGHASLPERLRFQDEARAVAAIQHPGVVQIYEVGEHEGLPFFALEYCAEGSLSDRLRGTPLAAKEAASIVERLARAIQAAHDKGIVHRDLKPANVLLQGPTHQGPTVREGATATAGALPHGRALVGRALDFDPKITDFGLAKKLEVAGITRPGELMGTPSYMSPEQAGMEPIGPACDIYALGAILYECLTGRPPFRGASMLETLEQVRSTEPVSVRALAPSTSRDLETICLKCLRKEPVGRYPSAHDLAEDLRRWQNGEPIVARPVGPAERAVKAVRRRPLVWSLLATAVLAMVSGTIVSLLFAREARQQAAVARENEAEAIQKGEELREARGQVEQTLAAGLLRPLGHSHGYERLNDFEMKALADLATLPREWDRVRVLMIDQALQSPTTAGQLERRLESALTAALGLDARKRQEVLAILARRLADRTTPPDARRACARLAVALEVEDPDLAATTSGALLDAVERANDLDTLRLLAADYDRLASRLDAKAASRGRGILATRLTAAIKETAEHEELKGLTESYLSLVTKLDPATARKGAIAAADQLLTAIPLAQEVVSLKAMADLVARLSKQFDTAEADKVSTQLLKYLTTKTGNPEVQEALTEVVVRVTDKQDAKTRQRALAAVSARLCELTGKAGDGLALKTLARTFTRVGVGSEAEAAASASHVLGILTKTDDAFALEPLAEAYSILLQRVDRKAAAAEAARGLQHVLDALAGRPDEFAVEPLGRAAVRLAERVDPAEARKGAGRLAGLVEKCDDAATLASLTLAYSALAGRLEPAAAHGMTEPLAVHVLGLMRDTKESDALLRLRGSFSHLASRLDRPAARAMGAKAAALLHEETKRTDDPVAVAELLDGIRMLEEPEGERGRSPRAEAALARLLDTVTREPDSAGRLTRAFAILAPYAEASAAREGATKMLQCILDRRHALDAEHAALLAYLSPAELVNLLKHPCCTGPSRRRVLDRLGKRLGTALDSVWDLPRLSQASLQGIDLLAPVEHPGGSPPPRETPARIEKR